MRRSGASVGDADAVGEAVGELSSQLLWRLSLGDLEWGDLTPLRRPPVGVTLQGSTRHHLTRLQPCQLSLKFDRESLGCFVLLSKITRPYTK
jgi:hypothetical protein